MPPDKERNYKLMKLSLTYPQLQNLSGHNTSHILPLLSEVLHNRIVFAFVTVNNGCQVLVGRFMFWNDLLLYSVIMWHTWKCSLWLHRRLTMKCCCHRSVPLAGWSWQKEMSMSSCSHIVGVIITSLQILQILAWWINLWASAAVGQLNPYLIFGPEPFLFRIWVGYHWYSYPTVLCSWCMLV